MSNRPASMVGTQEILNFSDSMAKAEAAAVVIRRALECNLQQKKTEAALMYTEKGLDRLIDELRSLRASYNRELCDPIIDAAIATEAAAIRAEEEKRRRKHAEANTLFTSGDPLPTCEIIGKII